MVDSSQDCPICCDEFNNSTNKRILCPTCPKTQECACIKCVKQYILSVPQEAHCMFCKKVWSQKFLYSTFTKCWIEKDYRSYYKNILFELEKAKLPDVMMRLPDLKKEHERIQLIIELKKQAKLMRREKDELLGKIKRKKEKFKVRKISDLPSCEQTKCKDFRKKINKLNADVKEQKFSISEIDVHIIAEPKKRRPIQPCPKEDCNGIIESLTFSCVICDTKICKSCRIIKNDSDNHECKSEDLETVKLIRTDTKGCPKCAIPIFKISGCDQMYCVECNTAFSWQTGKIVTGVIHNPHYYEYIRKTQGSVPRNPGDNPGGCREGILVELYIISSKLDINMAIIHRLVGEMQTRIRSFQRICNNSDNTLTKLREQFALESLTETEWKRKIFLLDRNHKRDLCRLEFFQMFYDVFVDLFNKVLMAPNDVKLLRKFQASWRREADTFINYFNDTAKEEMKYLGGNSPPRFVKNYTNTFWSTFFY